MENNEKLAKNSGRRNLLIPLCRAFHVISELYLAMQPSEAGKLLREILLSEISLKTKISVFCCASTGSLMKFL